MLGLGLGIDYGLLMVNRFREGRARGLDVHRAVQRPSRPPGRRGLLGVDGGGRESGLFVFGIPLLSSFGLAGLGVVLLCMVSSITLLPAVMAMVGGRIEPARGPEGTGRFFRVARLVQRRAGIVTVATVCLLLAFSPPRFWVYGSRTGRPQLARARPRCATQRSFLPIGTLRVVRTPSPWSLTSLPPILLSAVGWQASRPRWLADVTVRPGDSDVAIVDITPVGTSQDARHDRAL